MVFGAKRQAYASQTQATNQTHCTRKFVKTQHPHARFTRGTMGLNSSYLEK